MIPIIHTLRQHIQRRLLNILQTCLFDLRRRSRHIDRHVALSASRVPRVRQLEEVTARGAGEYAGASGDGGGDGDPVVYYFHAVVRGGRVGGVATVVAED